MFRGDIYSISDYDEACRLCQEPNNLVLSFLDNTNEYFGGLPVLGVSYLLPPYDACEAENLGYWEDFYAIYYNHLNNDMCQSYFASIFSAMIIGRNVFCYISEDEIYLEFFPAFANYCEEVFGLTIGNAEHECMFNRHYTERVKDLVLRHGYIDKGYLEDVVTVSKKQKEPDNCPWTIVIPPDAV